MSPRARRAFVNIRPATDNKNSDEELTQMATDVISTCCSAPLEYAMDGQGPTAAAALCIANGLQLDNPRLNGDKFMSACGFLTGSDGQMLKVTTA